MAKVLSGTMLWGDDEFPADPSPYDVLVAPWHIWTTRWRRVAGKKGYLHLPATYSRPDHVGGPHDVLKNTLDWLTDDSGRIVGNAGGDYMLDLRLSAERSLCAGRELADYVVALADTPDGVFLDCTWDSITWKPDGNGDPYWTDPARRVEIDADWKAGVHLFLTSFTMRLRFVHRLDVTVIGNGDCTSPHLDGLCYEHWPHSPGMLGQWAVLFHPKYGVKAVPHKTTFILPGSQPDDRPGDGIVQDRVVAAVAFGGRFCRGDCIVIDNAGRVPELRAAIAEEGE